MLPLDRQRMFEKSGAANCPQPALALAILSDCPILAHHLAVMAEVDSDVEARQRNAAHHLVNVAELGLFGAHKFAPRRGVVEQIEDFQGGADRMRRRLHRHRLIAAFGIRLPGFLLFRRARGERQTRHRADTGQRFAAKTEADNGFEIVERGDFAGRVASQGQRQLVFFDAAAVIANANELRAAAFDININSRGARIKAVFNQLFHHRRGPFHHFAGGNLVGELRRQNLNRHPLLLS